MKCMTCFIKEMTTTAQCGLGVAMFPAILIRSGS